MTDTPQEKPTKAPGHKKNWPPRVKLKKPKKKKRTIIQENKQTCNGLRIICTPNDLDLWNAAAVVAGYTRPSNPQLPNRSMWVLAVLRKAARDLMRKYRQNKHYHKKQDKFAHVEVPPDDAE